MKARIFACAMAVVLATAGVAAPAAAGVESISLNNVGPTPQVTIENTSASKAIANMNLQPKESSISFVLGGNLKCAKNSEFSGADSMFAYYGWALANDNGLDVSQTMHGADHYVALTIWSSGQWITEYADPHAFVVPLSKIKTGGHPVVRFDPVAEFNARLNQHVANGGNKLQFLRHDQTFTVQRNLSLAGSCSKKLIPHTKGWKSATVTASIKVVYKGDPDLQEFIVAVPQGGGGFQAGYNPLTMTEGELKAFQPNFIGNCPAEPKFRVTIKGGGKGEVKIRINEGGSTIHDSVAIPFANGEAVYEFTFPIKFPGKLNLNKKESHDFRLYAKAKDEKENFFPAAFQYYDQLTWHHTCTPKLNVTIGGQGGIKAKDEEAPVQGLKLKVQPGNPDPDPSPTPTLRLKKPTLQPLQIQPQSSPTRN